MAEFGTSPEDKFKLSLLSIEKRFVELEGATGELQQKVQNIQAPDTKELEERMSDLEDLVVVEQAGIEELKGMLESQQESEGGISAEDVEKIIAPIASKIRNDLENRINNLKNSLQNQQNTQQTNEIKSKLTKFEAQLQAIHHFRAELDNLRNKVDPLNPDTIKSIVAEISDLRIETSREIRELKEKVGNAPLYADIQFLSNRVKDLKLTVDNLLNMKVEIDAKILNMERNLAEGSGGSSSVAANLISEVEDTKKLLFGVQKRISLLDSEIKGMHAEPKTMEAGKMQEMLKEVEGLYTRLNEIYSDAERKTLDMNRLAPVDFSGKISNLNEKISELEEEMQQIKSRPSGRNRIDDEQIKELLEKIILLETRVSVLETSIVEPKTHQPIILE